MVTEAKSLSIADKLAAAIARQQAEVTRLANVAKVELPAAQAQLAELVQLSQSKNIAAIESAVVTLKAHGIRLDE